MLKKTSIDDLAKLAPWHFDIALSPNLKTSDGNQDCPSAPKRPINPNRVRNLLHDLYPEGLNDRSFLDAACNAGAYCFAARDLGADRILGFDVREHWMTQARFLQERLDGDYNDIRFVQGDLLEADSFLGEEQFDLCLFKGIFYHLPDPVAGLQMVAKRTTDTIIVDTAAARDKEDGYLELYYEGVENTKSGVYGLAWRPTGPEVIMSILNWMGFPYTKVIYWKKQKCRLCVVGTRDPSRLQNLEK